MLCSVHHAAHPCHHIGRGYAQGLYLRRIQEPLHMQAENRVEHLVGGQRLVVALAGRELG